MGHNRKIRDGSSRLFHAREDDEGPRHDVGGSISDIVNEETEDETVSTIGAIDRNDLEGDIAGAGDTLEIEIGLDVVGACGHKIGEVVDIRPEYLVVERGFFVPEDVYVPKSAIAEADEHRIKLDVDREAVDQSDWDQDPDGIEDKDLIEDVDERL